MSYEEDNSWEELFSKSFPLTKKRIKHEIGYIG